MPNASVIQRAVNNWIDRNPSVQANRMNESKVSSAHCDGYCRACESNRYAVLHHGKNADTDDLLAGVAIEALAKSVNAKIHWMMNACAINGPERW